MIGQVLQHILDKGFFVKFMYDGGIGYIFRAYKYLDDNNICEAQWVVSDLDVSHGIHKEVLVMDADRYLKQIDDNITQRRLIDSALKS